MPDPRYDVSLDFLARWYAPDVPWVLVAIPVDDVGIETRSFQPSTAEDCRRWLEDKGGYCNLYFHVNPLDHPTDKKARKEDVAALAALHLDIDPRSGEDLEEEQKRILGLLRSPPEGIPTPSVVLFSGGGYQAFWRLASPFPLDGNWDDAEAYNRQLELVFGADSCHNVDRIMRLPGTLNRPDLKKRKRGRKLALAELVEFNDRTYELRQFVKAARIQQTVVGFDDVAPAPGNVRRLKDINELPSVVPDWAKVLIVQGDDPDDPDKYPSKSEALFAAVCALVRASVEDETIYSVITDPGFAISTSVLSKPDVERYAGRQILRAHEATIAPELLELNDRFAVIGDYGGRCRIIEEVDDPIFGRPIITRYPIEDFKARFSNRKVVVGTDAKGSSVTAPLGKWWFGHENRRQYDRIVFLPGAETPPATFNLWRGFAVEALPGDCSRFLAHVHDNICSGVEAYYEYLLNWAAYATQRPAEPGHVAVVLRGGQGTGKGTFARGFGGLWGRHFLHVSNPKFLVGAFNAHLRDCSVLFGDEAFGVGNREHEAVLKTLVTEETLTIEAKGVDAVFARNFVHLILASNEDWIIPAGMNERRFFVLDVGEGKAQHNAYFAAIFQELENGGREALLHVLRSRDISSFDVRKFPKTEALSHQQDLSLPVTDEWWRSKLARGRIFEDDEAWTGRAYVADLYYDLVTYARAHKGHDNISATRFGLFFKESLPGLRLKRSSTTASIYSLDGSKVFCPRPRYYIFPSLEDCRALWDARRGNPTKWEDAEDDEEPDTLGI